MFYDDSGVVRLPHACALMIHETSRADSPFRYIPWSREYVVTDRSSLLSMTLRFCPFCGVGLPASLRDDFFAKHVEGATVPSNGAIDGDAWWIEDNSTAMDYVEVVVEGPSKVMRAATRREALIVSRMCAAMPTRSASPVYFQQGAKIYSVPAIRRIETAQERDGASGQTLSFAAECGELDALALITAQGGRVIAVEFPSLGPEAWSNDLEYCAWQVEQV